MKKITIHDKKTNKVLLEYEGDIIPMVGDEYAGVNFEDKQMRVVISRLLVPGAPNYLNVYVDFRFPELLPKELTETELNLVSNHYLS
jgi:hypothetical protein